MTFWDSRALFRRLELHSEEHGDFEVVDEKSNEQMASLISVQSFGTLLGTCYVFDFKVTSYQSFHKLKYKLL